MARTPDWLTDAAALRAAQPALARAVFAAVVETLADGDERGEYERVLDAALAGAGGDQELAMGLLRHQCLEEPQVERLHWRVDRRWQLILDETRTLHALSHSIIPPDADWLVPLAAPDAS